MKAVTCLSLAALVSSGLFGCAGETGPEVSRSYSGLFVGVYDRAEGAVMVFAEPGGQATVEVFDPTAGSFSGTGTISSDGAFAGTATRGAAQIALAGQFQGDGASATFSADVTGAFTVRATGWRRGASGTGFFAGGYAGTLSPWPGEQASLTFVVDAAGSVTGTLTDRNIEPATVYDVTGQVNEAGKVTLLHKIGAGDSAATRFEVTGSLYPKASGIGAGGLWTTAIPGFDPASGTWAGQKN